MTGLMDKEVEPVWLSLFTDKSGPLAISLFASLTVSKEYERISENFEGINWGRQKGALHVNGETIRMVFMRLAIICFLLLTVTGCDWLAEDFEVITLDELNRLKCEWQQPKVSRWFYIGSKEGYHIFIHRDLPGDKHYKIKTSEFKIDDPIYVSSNEVNWLPMSWGPGAKECEQ